MSLLILVGLFGLVYVFFLRPRAQAARRQRDTLMELNVGDEVLTAAGIFGTVLDVESDRVTLETAPGTRLTVVRSTIARRITQPDVTEPTAWDEHDDDEVHDAYHDYKSGSDDDDDEDADHDHDDVEDHDEVDEPEEVDEDDDSAEGHDPDEHDEHAEVEDHDHDDDAADAGDDAHDVADSAEGADSTDGAQGEGVAADDQDVTGGGRRSRRKRRPA